LAATQHGLIPSESGVILPHEEESAFARLFRLRAFENQQGEAGSTRIRLGARLRQYQVFPSRLSHSQVIPQTNAVQVRNETTGPAMSLLINSTQLIVYLRVLKRQPSFSPVEQPHRANSSEIKPDGSRASGLTFVEDFTLEHSRLGLNTTSIEISGSF
jgi:hypothetical protein